MPMNVDGSGPAAAYRHLSRMFWPLCAARAGCSL
jgi:hypothetical protein